MPTVTIRETYDLSTKKDKMTLIGIHTPSKNIIKRLYPGFCEQYKFVKILHQNVRVASAQRLPIDPAGIGVNPEGQVSPEDMFNPILYKAVSNQSLSNLEYRIRGLKYAGLTVAGESVDTSNNNVSGLADEFDVYYSILSNTRGWKVAHPQAGLKMSRLKPLVFEKWYNEGVNAYDENALMSDTSSELESDRIPVDGSSSTTNVINKTMTRSMRGRPHRMPAFNTKYLTGVNDISGEVAPAGSFIQNGFGDGSPLNGMLDMPDIPTIYTGIILTQPSRSTILYYRMVVETVVSFFGVQTMDEITPITELNNRTAFPVYWNDYRSNNKDTVLTVEENTVTVSDGATVKKIMES